MVACRKVFENFSKMLLARVTSRGAFERLGKFFKILILGRVKMVWNAWEIVSSWDRAEKASKRPFSGLVSISPGNSRYNETQNPEIWIFFDSRKSVQIWVKIKGKRAISGWKIHFLWTPLRGRFSAKNTNFSKIFRISFHLDFHFSSQIPSFRWKIRFSRKTSNFDFSERFSRFLHEQNFP